MLIGPSFDYSRIGSLVPWRNGLGPVWVAWDTNVLSLYERYGVALWDGDELNVRGDDANEVEALGGLIFVWLWWDLRFMVLDATVTDSKRPRPPEAVTMRREAMAGLARALSLGLDGWGGEPEARKHDLPERAIHGLPRGHDRLMVREAYRVGADVFLTADKGILKRAGPLRDQGLVCLSARELLDELVGAGVLLDEGPYQLGNGLIPDLGRMAALLEALGV